MSQLTTANARKEYAARLLARIRERHTSDDWDRSIIEEGLLNAYYDGRSDGIDALAARMRGEKAA